MVAEDYYGPNYLEDIALATRYTQADLIGKAARYTWEGGKFELKQPRRSLSPSAVPAGSRGSHPASDYRQRKCPGMGAIAGHPPAPG